MPGVRWRRSGTAGVHPITDFDDGPRPAYCQGPMAAVKCPVTTWASGGTSFHNESTLDRYQLRSVLTWVAEGLGHHVVKVGGDAEYITYDQKKAYGGGILYRESADGTNFANFRSFGYLTGPDTAVLLPALQTTTSAFAIGGFLQDSWSVMDKVTVNAGIRYDAQYLYNTDEQAGPGAAQPVVAPAGLHLGSHPGRPLAHLRQLRPVLPERAARHGRPGAVGRAGPQPGHPGSRRLRPARSGAGQGPLPGPGRPDAGEHARRSQPEVRSCTPAPRPSIPTSSPRRSTRSCSGWSTR